MAQKKDLAIDRKQEKKGKTKKRIKKRIGQSLFEKRLINEIAGLPHLTKEIK